MIKIVLFLTFSVLCVVHTQSDDGCRHSRSYTRVKRGKYYPGPPLRFYNRPPITIPIKGPFSYTPPPFMPDDEPQYPGSRPYKVSKRPPSDGLGDNDINNLVKHLTKQDLDKIIEFANEKDKYSTTKDFYNEISRPHIRENLIRPTYTKEIYKGNIDTNYRDEKPFEIEFMKYLNYVTEATPTNFAAQDDRRNPYPIDPKPTRNQVTFYSPQDEQRISAPIGTEGSLTSQGFTNSQEQNTYPVSYNSYFSETTEEDQLPPPVNMREEDFVVSYTNNVPTVVGADSSAYKAENFGDLPLMNYNSKLHTVSSYHVPHYTVTQPKTLPQSPASSLSSFSSSQSFSSSSTLLKPSPAAASIKAPLYEPAPPASAAKEQSDAHLKATKIWSHRSKGAAYTLHDDGTLTPERSRPTRHYG